MPVLVRSLWLHEACSLERAYSFFIFRTPALVPGLAEEVKEVARSGRPSIARTAPPRHAKPGEPCGGLEGPRAAVVPTDICLRVALRIRQQDLRLSHVSDPSVAARLSFSETRTNACAFVSLLLSLYLSSDFLDRCRPDCRSAGEVIASVRPATDNPPYILFKNVALLQILYNISAPQQLFLRVVWSTAHI
ncbi:hypothetical protein Q3G72_031311 [Acer saccharum]|nr:hypothetical protein Q3G72_031311 [Acer saccharum]